MRDALPEIHLLGQFVIRRRQQTVALHIAGATRELLAYLLNAAGREVRREALVEAFWGETDFNRAKAALNTAIWRINRVLRPLRGMSLTSTGSTVRLDTVSDILIDTRRLETTVRATPRLSWKSAERLSEATRDSLLQAVDGYGGPFMDGSASTWVLVERERLSNLHVRGLSQLMHHSELERDYEDALDFGRRILAVDPFREQTQCEVMWLYVLSGQRVRALTQYRDYETLLSKELGIRPMAETRTLYELIKSDRLIGDGERTAPFVRRGARTDGSASSDPLALIMAAIERSRQTAYEGAASRVA